MPTQPSTVYFRWAASIAFCIVFDIIGGHSYGAICSATKAFRPAAFMTIGKTNWYVATGA
jgi:hypothetical protein